MLARQGTTSWWDTSGSNLSSMRLTRTHSACVAVSTWAISRVTSTQNKFQRVWDMTSVRCSFNHLGGGAFDWATNWQSRFDQKSLGLEFSTPAGGATNLQIHHRQAGGHRCNWSGWFQSRDCQLTVLPLESNSPGLWSPALLTQRSDAVQ